MIPMRPFRISWLLFFLPFILQGCTTGGSTGWSRATVEENARSADDLGSGDQLITPEMIAPFLGNWQGTWEEDYSNKSISTTSETRRALLIVKMVAGKPVVTWALGAATGGGTWHDSRVQSPPSLGRYSAKFSKTDGIVFMEFTTRLGNNYRFLRNENQIHGKNTSAGFSVRCSLTLSSQQEPFTDAALSQFEVALN